MMQSTRLGFAAAMALEILRRNEADSYQEAAQPLFLDDSDPRIVPTEPPSLADQFRSGNRKQRRKQAALDRKAATGRRLRPATSLRTAIPRFKEPK